MANSQPYDQLVGPLQVYIAPYGEAVPAVNATPAGNWVLLGPTDGEQSLQHMGKLTYFRDNDHQAPVKAVRPDEDIVLKFVVVGLTLENYARIISRTANLVSAGGPPATRKLPLKRGAVPTEYAFLFKGSALSPYGALPGMFVLTRAVFDGEPQFAVARDGRAGLECEIYVLDDPAVSGNDSMGYLIVQTS